MITKDKKETVMTSAQRHKTDVGSPEVQTAIMTARIKELTEHLKENKHDFMARRGLLALVGQRRRLLDYVRRKDFDAYKDLIQKLGLRK
jgi:small subunit ribosomal protein S15